MLDIAYTGASSLEDAEAMSDLFDLAEDLGGEVTVDGVIRFDDEADLDAFCELLAEEFGIVVA